VAAQDRAPEARGQRRQHSKGAPELIRAPLDALTREGGVIMANKASFSPDEWTKVLQSGMMSAIAFTAADPSGLWGTLKESMVAGHALLEAKQDAGSNELIKAVVA